MPKKVLTLLITAALAVAMLSSNVLAAAGRGSGLQDPTASMNQLGTIELVTDPLYVQVTGSITFQTPLKEVSVYVRKTDEEYTLLDRIDESGNDDFPLSAKKNSPYGYSFTWAITEAGTYYLYAMGVVANDGSKKIDPAISNEITVTVFEPEDTGNNGSEIDQDSPAAPAIAGKILRELGYKPKYGSVNIISLVARAMDKGAAFPVNINGNVVLIPKSDTEAYYDAVYDFVIDVLDSIDPDAVKARKDKDDIQVKAKGKPEKPGKSADSKEGKGKAAGKKN